MLKVIFKTEPSIQHYVKFPSGIYFVIRIPWPFSKNSAYRTKDLNIKTFYLSKKSGQLGLTIKKDPAIINHSFSKELIVDLLTINLPADWQNFFQGSDKQFLKIGSCSLLKTYVVNWRKGIFDWLKTHDGIAGRKIERHILKGIINKRNQNLSIANFLNHFLKRYQTFLNAS